MMTKEQVIQNVSAIAEKCQKGGLLTLQESKAVLETLDSLVEYLKEEEVNLNIEE